MRYDVSHRLRDVLVAYTTGYLIFVASQGLQIHGYVRSPFSHLLSPTPSPLIEDTMLTSNPGPPRLRAHRRALLRVRGRVGARGHRAVQPLPRARRRGLHVGAEVPERAGGAVRGRVCAPAHHTRGFGRGGGSRVGCGGYADYQGGTMMAGERGVVVSGTVFSLSDTIAGIFFRQMAHIVYNRAGPGLGTGYKRARWAYGGRFYSYKRCYSGLKGHIVDILKAYFPSLFRLSSGSVRCCGKVSAWVSSPCKPGRFIELTSLRRTSHESGSGGRPGCGREVNLK